MALALFIKCLIMIVYDLGSQLYMPCTYSLKVQKMPSAINIDFKKALINACNQEFLESKLIRCYFYLKQALHSKLNKLYPNQPKI
ncbi:hypothetical protein MXB_3401 [Myxobolus squamalis]|nr:hypothetical protein MXB_3401 [Myxobolus squamalis]